MADNNTDDLFPQMSAEELMSDAETSYTGRDYTDIGEIRDWYSDPKSDEDFAKVSAVNHSILNAGTKPLPANAPTHTRNKILGEKSAKFDRAASKKYVVRIGWFPGKNYPESGESVASIAALQEYGGTAIAPNMHDRRRPNGDNPQIGIPPRPFLRPLVRSRGKEFALQAARGVLHALFNGDDPNKAMEQVGEQVKEELQDSIRSVDSPPLSAKTIARREYLWRHHDGGGEGHGTQLEKPLIDTGRMISSIEVKVG